MITVNDVFRYLDQLAPGYMKEDWDRVGLNCGHADKEVKTVLIALDPFRAVCQEAKEIGAELVVTHHALLWEPGYINDQSEQGRNALFLIENNIAHINAHTNLDCAPGGVNDLLAEKLALQDVRVLNPKGTDAHGREWGLVRKGRVRSQNFENFLAHVKTALGCDGLRFVDGGRPVSLVAVGGGACANELEAVAAAGCDTFVTADVKYNQFWDAKALGINLIDAGHFHTENPVCAYLADKLSEAFPTLKVVISTRHGDCTKFFL